MSTKNNLESKSAQHLFLESIEICGFKSIKSATIKLAPVTVLLGGNSSGKSSVIQSILLASQNTTRRLDTSIDFNGPAITLGTYGDVRHRGMKNNDPMSLKYNFSGMGSFSLFEGTSTSIEFKIAQEGTSLDSRRSTVPVSSCSVTMQVPGKKPAVLTSRPIADSLYSDLEAEKRIFSISGDFFTSGSFVPMKTFEYNMFLSSLGNKPSRLGRKSINVQVETDSRGSFFPAGRYGSRDFQVETYKWRILIATIATLKNLSLKSKTSIDSELNSQADQEKLAKIKKEYSILTKELEDFFSEDSDYIKTEDIRNYETIAALQKLLALINEGKLVGFENKLYLIVEKNPELIGFENSTLQEIITAITLLSRNEVSSLLGLEFSRNGILRPEVQPYFENASAVEEALSNYLMMSVHYLGPLRAHSVADQSGWAPRSALIPFGVRGEGLGAALDSPQSRRKLTYPLPPSSSGSFEPVVKRVSLNEALNSWVKWFNLGSNVGADVLGAYGSHLELDSEKMFQKGTGVSQLLPVLALALRARPGSLIMIEQPELHLHPALQQRLGTFFALLSKTKRRFIIETHSEYIVTRLRREVAVGKISSNDLGLLFVNAKKSSQNFNVSSFKSAPVSNSGLVSNWPEGFFDFTSDDKLDILIASRAMKIDPEAKN
jgi:hypothetical protein